MTVFAAFLRGVNLGKRTVKSADLRAAFEDMGFPGARTLIASGNVLFEGKGTEEKLRRTIETGLEKRFGFDIGTVLRSQDELRALIASDPFDGRTEDADTKLYVTFLAEKRAGDLSMDASAPGEFEIARITDREVFFIGYRQPNGRFSERMGDAHKPFAKSVLWTNRNWNTVLKAAA